MSALVTCGGTGAGALLARCLWRAGIAFTDSGAAAVGLPQPAHALEAWEFSEPWKTRHFDRHSEFARGWQRFSSTFLTAFLASLRDASVLKAAESI